jgi:hypothetical protein
MAAQIRPIPKLAKVAYQLLKTDKGLQQKNTTQPTERQRQEWATTYSKSNVR